MRPDLFDVLVEAKADPPASRLDVDEIVAAGKRRQRRRTAGWVMAAAAAAAVAIAIPQLTTRPVTPPAAPAVPEPRFTFSGFTAGQLRVGDPTIWEPDVQWASVSNLRGDHDYGLLYVYRPGADPWKNLTELKIIDDVPVHGRRAFFVEHDNERSFAWDYGGGALAVLRVDESVRPAEQRRIAEVFSPSTPRPVLLSFKVGHLPTGYRLARVREGASVELSAPGRFVPSLMVEIGGPNQVPNRFGSLPSCKIQVGGRTECGVMSADGRYEIHVLGDEITTQSELFKILTSVEYAGTATFPVSEALPESALAQR